MNLKTKYFILFLLLSSYCLGQTVINGTVLDDVNNPLEAATIIAYDAYTKNILQYTTSNENGIYTLRIANKIDSLVLKVSFIGFESQEKKLVNRSAIINFLLKESNQQLKEVFLKNKPIVQRNDTLNYMVSQFKNEKDQVIADVLKRMPGIEVQLDGRILYMGKPIQKYYIEGLDLLEGRYNLANNNLPVNAVSRIQVLENHQPIKILDSVVFSDRASLNIKLKKKNVLIGSAKMGAGFSPSLWDVNVTPMLFSKKRQIISSYQTNNIGANVLNDLKPLTTLELLDELNGKTKPIRWLGVLPISLPPLSEKKWLNNSIHLFSTNYLVKLKKEYQLKASVSYVNDVQKQLGSIKTSIFTPSGTIHINENKEIQLFVNQLLSRFTLEKNTKKGYFKNNLEYNASWNSEKGLTNNGVLNERTQLPTIDLKNDLKWIIPVKQKLLILHSQLFYNENSNQLQVKPGKFEELFNNSQAYNDLNQEVKHLNFYIDNSIEFTKSFKNFTLIPKIGIEFQEQELRSAIFLDNSSSSLPNDSFLNSILLREEAFYATTLIQIENKFFNAKLELPLKQFKINKKDRINNQNNSLKELIFEPSITLSKDLNAFWTATASFDRKKSFGSIDQLYTGFIVSDYRNVKAFNSEIPTTIRHSQRLRISYKNPVNGIFVNGFYSQTKNWMNLLYHYDYSTTGAVSITTTESENSSKREAFGVKISKFFSELSTTFVIGGSEVIFKKQQFVNADLLDVSNIQQQVNTQLDIDITAWLNVNTKATFSFFNAVSSLVKSEELRSSFLEIETNFFLSDRQFLGFQYAKYANNLLSNQDNDFLDIVYRYRLPKNRFNFELKWTNMLNTSNYENVFLSELSSVKTTYRIRPSQLLASLTFRF